MSYYTTDSINITNTTDSINITNTTDSTITTNSTKVSDDIFATATSAIDASYINNEYRKALESFSEYFFITKDTEAIKEIIELVPQKVYKIIFFNGKSVKTILDDLDTFDPEYMLFLAYAKMLYSKDLTFEGVLNKSYQLQYEKRYVKLVKNGLKIFKKIQEDKRKEEEEKEIKKRRHEKLVTKKIAAKKRKRENKINIIAEAIRRSKEEG